MDLHRKLSAMQHTVLAEISLAMILGVFAHWLYFINGDNHHMRAPLYLRAYLIALLGIHTYQRYMLSLSYSQACNHMAILVSSYCAALFASIVMYRYFFHRVRSFPGPKLAAITKFWHVWQVRQSQNHLVLTALQKKYGDFVRTGPNEITIFHPDALNASNGPASDCTKANWYDFLKPQTALNTSRDVAEHDMRRKLWKPSFVRESLDKYGHVLLKYLDQLDLRLESSNGEAVDIVNLAYWWSFDVMGELTLSMKFNMLSNVPWLARLGFSIPGVARDWHKMISFCKNQTERRLAIKQERLDIAQHLVEHARQVDGSSRNKHYLEGDVIAMIIAGSDTVASAIVYALYHIAAEPTYQEAIRNEIRAADMSDLHDPQAIQNLSMLDAVIKETLRLHPPVVTGGPRDTGPDGLHVAGHFIPPQTTVIVPRYTIARLATSFSDPDVFLPSRWLRGSGAMVHNPRAFAPFGAGKYACIGRALAMRELKLTLTRLVVRYNIKFASGEDGLGVVAAMKDQFTAVPGSLRLSFLPRDRP